MREIRELEVQLTRVAGLLREDPDPTDLRAEKVSGWSVGEQLDHVIRVLDSSLTRLSAPGKPLDRGINVVGRILLRIGRLPRGVGKSPRSLLPDSRSRRELADALEDVRGKLRSLAAQADVWRSQRPVVPHPYFGGLTPRQGARMLAVHTDHHLRIVDDIRRAAGR